eukprot:7046899-Alexandrium_andersonii.AAC.1
MSASLVGSEMCIRDSITAAFGARAASWHVVGDVQQACRAPRWSSSRDPPVSYTHLTLPTICSV